jgi:hypothetical protein
MVDRRSRDELARAIRRLIAGIVTNDEFDHSLSAALLRSRDLGVQSVRLAAWTLYSDMHEYRLEGPRALNRTARRGIARWIVFLRSDVEYQWPNLTGWRWLVLAFPNMLTFGAIGWLVRRWHDRHGEADAWPFVRLRDLVESAEKRCVRGGRLDR